MSNRARDIEPLRAVNPVPSRPEEPEPLDLRASRDLDAILRVARASGSRAVVGQAAAKPPRRPRAALVGGLAIAASVVLIAGGVATGRWVPTGGDDIAFAATPPLLQYAVVVGSTDAASVLEDLAARVEQLPDDTGQGDNAYVEQQSWSLFTRIDNKVVTSEVVPQRIRAWRGSDGSGRIETTTMGGDSAGEETDTYGPGELSAMWPLKSLSPDYQTLAAQLAIGHPEENGPAERLVAIQDAYLEMPISPAVRAGMLRYLADTVGLELEGDVTDRAGRPGLAFSLESDFGGLPAQYTVIIDPDSGQLLGSEEMLTTDAGKLNVQVPAVIQYTAYLDARYEQE